MSKVIPMRSSFEDGGDRDIRCTFDEFDEIREKVRNLAGQLQKPVGRPWKRKAHYDYSRFYVGRGVSYIKFKRMYLPVHQMKRFAEQIGARLPKFTVYHQGRDLMVYTRGEKR